MARDPRPTRIANLPRPSREDRPDIPASARPKSRDDQRRPHATAKARKGPRYLGATHPRGCLRRPSGGPPTKPFRSVDAKGANCFAVPRPTRRPIRRCSPDACASKLTSFAPGVGELQALRLRLDCDGDTVPNATFLQHDLQSAPHLAGWDIW